jgi:hypothetical protein
VCYLTTQYGDLVPEHQELDLVGAVGSSPRHDEPEDAKQRPA